MIGEEKELFVQVIGDSAEEMVDEAKYVNQQLTGNVFVKLPATEEGIKAIKLLSSNNIPT